MYRLVALLFTTMVLIFVLPAVVRQLGTTVAAGQPYRWSGDTSVFVRVPVGTLCQVTHDDQPARTIDVPPDASGWLGITGSDVAGKAGVGNTLVCERDATVIGGTGRLLTYPARAGGWLALLCVALCLAAIGFGLRITYLRLRRGLQ